MADRGRRHVGHELVEREKRHRADTIGNDELVQREAKRERVEGDRFDCDVPIERCGQPGLQLRPDDCRKGEPCDDRDQPNRASGAGKPPQPGRPAAC
jgi:hypothetical protein